MVPAFAFRCVLCSLRVACLGGMAGLGMLHHAVSLRHVEQGDTRQQRTWLGGGTDMPFLFVSQQQTGQADDRSPSIHPPTIRQADRQSGKVAVFSRAAVCMFVCMCVCTRLCVCVCVYGTYQPHVYLPYSLGCLRCLLASSLPPSLPPSLPSPRPISACSSVLVCRVAAVGEG